MLYWGAMKSFKYASDEHRFVLRGRIFIKFATRCTVNNSIVYLAIVRLRKIFIIYILYNKYNKYIFIYIYFDIR